MVKGLGSCRRCLDRITLAWPAFTEKRNARLMQQDRQYNPISLACLLWSSLWPVNGPFLFSHRQKRRARDFLAQPEPF